MNQFLNNTTGHMILGGITVLLFSPLFALFGFPWFILVMFVSTIAGLLKELGDHFGWWNHDENNFRQAMNDIAEWTFGGVIFTLFITIIKYGIN